MKVLLISPFGYAIKQKSKEIKTILKKQKVAAFIDEVIATLIQNTTAMKLLSYENTFKGNN